MTKREWLKDERKSHNYTLKELAQQLECSFSYLCDLEAGRRTPSGPMAYKIAKHLGFSMERFFEEKGETA